MFNLVNLHTENFMSIENIELAFDKPGNYLISGYSEIGGDSNGAGKSAILNSIMWALTGKTTKGLSGSLVTRWESEKSAKVTLQLTDSTGQSYQIIRTPELTSFLINGENIAGHKRDIQQTINDTFHTNYDLLLSTIMFTKNGAEFLTDSGDTAKKRLFKSLLRLDKIDKMYTKARDLHSALTTQAQTLEYDVGAKKSRWALLAGEIESYEQKMYAWEDKREADIKAYRLQLENQTPSLDLSLEPKLESLASYLQVLEAKIQEVETNFPALMESLSASYKDISYYNVLKESIERELLDSESLEGEICKYCGAKITKRGLSSHIYEKEQKIKEIESILTTLHSTMKGLEDSVNQREVLKRELIALTKEHQNTFSLVASQRQKIEGFEATKKQVQATIKGLETSENPYVVLCLDKKNERVAVSQDLEETTAKFHTILKTIDIYAYIKWVLSKEGVVAIIIEKTFSRLEALINHYLSAICTEGFYVTIKPQRELKSGAMKDEIEIVITSKGKKIPYGALSGGQEQRVTIAALLALYKLSKELGMNRFNFLLLDEVLDLSLAEKGQQEIIKLLEGMEGEIRNIFVISHKDNLSSEFPFQLDVRRGMDGITKLVGVYD